jgi:lipopolysaccharide heptosyltransferase I
MRILVVRLGSLGDLVHSLPAVAAIRRANPDAEIDWLVDEGHLDFLSLVPILSEIVVLRGRTARAWLDVRTRLRAKRYDAAVDFQGLLKSAALARLSGAARVIGFDRGALRERAAGPLYTEHVTVGEGHHVIDKNLRLAAILGAEAGPLEFPIRDVKSAVAGAIVAGDPRPFAILNTGGAWPNKRWPAERLGRVAAWLCETQGLRTVALWGPEEAHLAHEVVAASDGAATAAPPTSLPDLVALSRAAKLMVSGDTGPTHIAAAVGTPVVALFGPTNPRRNGPWDEDDVAVSRYEACSCHYERTCSRDAAHWCLATITERDVRQAIEVRLQRAGERSTTAGRSSS